MNEIITCLVIMVSMAMIKHYDQKYIGEKEFIQLTDSRPL